MMSSNQEFWHSKTAVQEYSVIPYLFRGEESALSHTFSGGLEGKHVLDLGCGAGRTSFFLDRDGADVVAVDVSQSLLCVGRKRFPNVRFFEGDARELGFKDAAFDLVVFSFNGLDCLFPKAKRLHAIQEIHRVLRKDGRFIFSHHNSAAIMFGWYQSLGLKKLKFRLGQILNGNALRNECYIQTPNFGHVSNLLLYYAWPKQTIQDLTHSGLELLGVFPNCPLSGFIQRTLKTDWVTRWCDPFPYYIFRKT